MKKVLSFIVCLTLAFTLFCGCSDSSSSKKKRKSTKDEEETTTTVTEVASPTPTEPEEIYYDIEPEEVQIRSMCQLATLECYFNNVAISNKEVGSGISHWGEKSRQFWVEYSAVATLGIDIGDVKTVVQGSTVTVYLPEATLLEKIRIDQTQYKNAPIVSDSDSKFNKNNVTAQDVTDAINESLKKLEEQVNNDKSLKNTAKDRAKSLIRNYIEKISKLSGKEYTVIFKDINELKK